MSRVGREAALIVPLVGAHFRPPARAVLNALPAGTRLELIAEPENPYDSGAIRVELEGPGVVISGESHQELEEALAGYGFGLSEVLSMPSIHLGYVARTGPKQPIGNEQAAKLMRNGRGCGRLRFDEKGKTMVEVEEPEGKF